MIRVLRRYPVPCCFALLTSCRSSDAEGGLKNEPSPPHGDLEMVALGHHRGEGEVGVSDGAVGQTDAGWGQILGTRVFPSGFDIVHFLELSRQPSVD